jgi:hypothetical protein
MTSPPTAQVGLAQGGDATTAVVDTGKSWSKNKGSASVVDQTACRGAACEAVQLTSLDALWFGAPAQSRLCLGLPGAVKRS